VIQFRANDRASDRAKCRCVSETGKGWRAFIAEDPDGDEPPEVATYCPPCADRELKPVYHAAGLRLSLAAAAVKQPGWPACRAA
jgi:hypothetical protein